MADRVTVVFDLGGVIVSHHRTWQAGCRAAGLPVRAGSTSAEMVAARHAVNDRHQRGELLGSAYYDAISAATGGLYSPAEAERVARSWLTGEYPGVARVFDALEAAGHRLGVLSNTNDLHWEMLPRYPAFARLLRDHGERVHASHLLGEVKPEPAAFAAYERAAKVSAAEAVFFDDRADNVHAAIAAGWRARAVDPDGDTAAQLLAACRELELIPA